MIQVKVWLQIESCDDSQALKCEGLIIYQKPEYKIWPSWCLIFNNTLYKTKTNYINGLKGIKGNTYTHYAEHLFVYMFVCLIFGLFFYITLDFINNAVNQINELW